MRALFGATRALVSWSGRLAPVALLALLASGAASAQDLPRGQIIEDVQCLGNAAQRYALYLPSNFTPARRWPVILAFDAGARGSQGVERYRAAAEKYGYVIAGSNNSRNGPWELGLDAAEAMAKDVKARFSVDPKRIYTAGMSGGARVAIMVAQRSSEIAGVLASSAGYADAFHESVRFPFFGSAGTEDFNYREMRAVDSRMTSAHRVEVFEGGHTWLPVELATNGVEWMEIQAMRSGLRPRDEKLLDELYAKRVARAERAATSLDKMRELKQLAADFDGFKNVATVVESAAALERLPEVAAALAAERDEDAREVRLTGDTYRLLRQLSWPEQASDAFIKMKAHVISLLEASRSASDSPERRMARRALTGLGASARGVPHPEFQDWLQQVLP